MLSVHNQRFAAGDNAGTCIICGAKSSCANDRIGRRYVDQKGAGGPMAPDFEHTLSSHYLSRLLARLTGCKSTNNILRSSFVNLLLSPEGNDPRVRASAASPMRHTHSEQARPYDRRKPADRKRIAQSVIGCEIARVPLPPVPVQAESPCKCANAPFARGDLVIVPYVDTDTHVTIFWFAKVMAMAQKSASWS
jgi:hypothetical protein